MNTKEIYCYPAVLTFEEGCEIAVTFPDFPGCATSGTDIADAVVQGREALGLHIYGMECDGDEIPEPSDIAGIELEKGEYVAFIDVFMPTIRFKQKNKAISRTVTIPAWLNAAAQERGVNFSQVLQDALKTELAR